MMNLQPRKSPLILIVDDDRSLRSLLHFALAEEGYETIEAKNGEQGLAEYNRLQPDMVLLDAIMPDMDGFTCCEKIRHDNDLVPILMITSLDDRPSVKRAFNAGATDYINKPIHWEVLSQRVRRLLIAHQSLTKAKLVQQQLIEAQNWEICLRDIIRYLQQPEAIKLDNLSNFFGWQNLILWQFEESSLVKEIFGNIIDLENIFSAYQDLQEKYLTEYQTGKIVLLEDIRESQLSLNIVNQFRQLNTQALLTAPIMINRKFSGLLCAHYTERNILQHDTFLQRFSDLAHLLSEVEF